jgi:hypothetical protein
MEEIALCEVKYGVPISNGKKIVQLIRLGGKKYGTIITVTQMCKKSKKVTCTPKHIVDKMWKQWRIKVGKEKGKENANDDEETTLTKVDDKVKEKGKVGGNRKDRKGKKKEIRTCNFCGVKGHIKDKCWKKVPSQMPEKIQRKKTKKAGAAVEEDHLLSVVNVCDNISIIQVDIEAAYVSGPITSIDYGF